MASPAVLYRLIAERDRHRCAYCLTTEENCGLQMHVDHILPEAAGGASTADNLCWRVFRATLTRLRSGAVLGDLWSHTPPSALLDIWCGPAYDCLASALIWEWR